MVLLSVAALAVSGTVAVPSVATALTGESGPIVRVGLNPGSATFGDAWPAGANVTVTADDPATSQAPDFSVPVTADAQGSFTLPEGFPGLEPAWFITATDGTHTKTHTVKNVAITQVDPATDVVQGTADPFAELAYVGAGGIFQGSPTTADGLGVWSVDITPWFDGVNNTWMGWDIRPGSQVVALQIDDPACAGDTQWPTCDGDFTYVNAVVPLDDPPVGWQYNPVTGHFYQQVGPYTWADAEVYAISLGGHLVTITDSAEQGWLELIFSEPNLWIGMNDRAAEGRFVWSSSEPVTYTNWTVFEPNNGGPSPGVGNEDAAAMNWADPWLAGRIGWNDLPELGTLGAIVEAAGVPVGPLLDNMVAEGQLPTAGVANSIKKQAAGKAPLRALTSHLSGLVLAGKITQPTMNEILASLPG